MIVSRAKAEEAHAILRSFYMGEIAGLPSEFDQLDKHVLTALYHSAARATHPDAGGKAEDFARVDWAKHALTAWLGTDKPAAAPRQEVHCPRCEGRGYIQRQHGFGKGARVQCPKCDGTG